MEWLPANPNNENFNSYLESILSLGPCHPVAKVQQFIINCVYPEGNIWEGKDIGNCERMVLTTSLFVCYCTIMEKSSDQFSLGGDNLKRYFDQR